jgi:F-type H+-transporting ATPase subunit b
MTGHRLRLIALSLLAAFSLAPLAEAEEAKKGMPQLDFSDPLLLSQVVWLAIIFLALYLLLSRWALPQVAEVLDERARRIKGDLEAARAAQEEALAARKELEAATRNAHAEAQTAIAQAIERAKQEAFEQARVLTARLEAELAAAEARIAEAEAAARRALRGAVEDTTRALVEKLLGRAPRDEVLGEVLAQVIARAEAG